MCTLAIYFRVSPEFPVVVAANRDEFYDRRAAAPMELEQDPWIVGGHDVVAGGTWLGVNGYGVLAGLLNRRSNRPLDSTLRSRGLLCLDMLREVSVQAASVLLQRQPADGYNPFNLLLASASAAYVAGNISGSMVLTQLQPGLHLLTNLEVNDFECPRIAKSYALFDAARGLLKEGAIAALPARLRQILSDHSTPLDPRSLGPPNNLCVHTEHFGTRSSTVLIYSARTQRYRMWYADGAPCAAEYREVALPHAAAPGQR
jgi:uncharacterized protein with NRDE domain